MREVALATALWLVVIATGCTNKRDVDGAADPEALRARDELIARRDRLMEARKKLKADREKVEIEIQSIEAKGGDASAQLKQRQDLDGQLQRSDDELETMVSSKLDPLLQSADKATRVAARESEIASRERTVAEREARIAERERALARRDAEAAQRDAEAAQRWKDACAAGTGTVVVQQAPPARSSTHSAKDVNAVLQRARLAMDKRHLLPGDLPGPAQALEREATAALADGDLGKAHFAASQWLASVEAVAIDRAFIMAKLSRLQAQVKSTTLDDATRDALAAILSDVVTLFTKGNFTAANDRLYSLAKRLGAR